MAHKNAKGEPYGSPLIQFRMKIERAEKLKRLAAVTGRSGAEQARFIVENWLRRQLESKRK